MGVIVFFFFEGLMLEEDVDADQTVRITQHENRVISLYTAWDLPRAGRRGGATKA